MNHTLLKKVVSSAIVVMVLTFLIAGLEFYGVTNVGLGRLCFVGAWVLSVGGLVFSEWLWSRSLKFRIAVGVLYAISCFAALIELDDWARLHGVPQQQSPVQISIKQEPQKQEENPVQGSEEISRVQPLQSSHAKPQVQVSDAPQGIKPNHRDNSGNTTSETRVLPTNPTPVTTMPASTIQERP
jgi:hypothetical protein